MIRFVLEAEGIDPGRYALEWVSSAEASRFAQVVTAFTAKVKALGPNREGPSRRASGDA